MSRIPDTFEVRVEYGRLVGRVFSYESARKIGWIAQLVIGSRWHPIDQKTRLEDGPKVFGELDDAVRWVNGIMSQTRGGL